MAIVRPAPADDDGNLYADCRLAGLRPDGVAAAARAVPLACRPLRVVRTTAMQRAKPRAEELPQEFICRKPRGLAWAGAAAPNANPPATRMAAATVLVTFWMGRINPPGGGTGGSGMDANRIHSRRLVSILGDCCAAGWPPGSALLCELRCLVRWRSKYANCR